MKIRRLPSKNYNAQIYLGIIDGHKKFKSITAPTREEVRALAAEFEQSGKYYAVDPKPDDLSMSRLKQW